MMVRFSPQKAIWPITLFLCLAAGAAAHPVSLTSVFVNVDDEAITAELDMLVEDLILYYWMESDENFRFPRKDLQQQAQEHRDFLLRYFQLRDRDGRIFEGEIVDIDFSELGEEGVHIDALMAHSIRYQFVFPFTQRPEFLTVSQNFGGDEPPVPAEMAVRFFHHGVQMEGVTLSHGTTHTVHLDWDAGWEHALEDLEAARERLRQRREDTLGITSYSAVYSYVYITDTEVRHEILIPLLTLETWLPLEREDCSTMTVEEQRAAREAIHAFLAAHNPVRIDGIPARPELERLDFFGPEYRDFARESPGRDVSVYNARVGVILSFPTEEPPRRLRFAWSYFDDGSPVFTSTLYAFEAEGRKFTLTPREPVFEWESDHERPVPRLAAIEAPPSPPMLEVPLLSLAGGLSSVIAAFAAIPRGSIRRRLICCLSALGLAAGSMAAFPHARAEIPLRFSSPPEITDETAQRIFKKLHANIYQAFAYRDDEQIYDGLEQSVAGPLLEELYLQIRRNLTIEGQGGAVSRIQRIEMLDGFREPLTGAAGNPGFLYRCEWTVTGTVEHWGHIHSRENRYEAVFQVEGLSSGWKITGFEPLREEPVDRRIQLRP